MKAATKSAAAPLTPQQLAAQETQQKFGKPERGWREQVYTVIFEAETRTGRAFDLLLIAAILISVTVVVLSSVASVAERYGTWLTALEWFFTILFTIEYCARLACLQHPVRYAKSFFGVIDLLAIVPTYIGLLLPGAHVLIDVRILRLLRMFRILKLTSYVHEYTVLGRALLASRRKILIFLSFVMMVVFLLGTVMYVVEGPDHGFSSIPTSIYWAISTMTTVGFGDITPRTDIGRTIASLMMLLGWGILAVPTGIISAEMTVQRSSKLVTTRTCPTCLKEGLDDDANFCKNCGVDLPPLARD
ncbi:voltage-gated potassium channel [Janthinobacterium sp. 35]|jgi:voltage-gated potassium channel|uniref:Ion transporter n=1 Tax=Janthinobacterium lividum TaxID=29581 RepID=A0A1S1UGY0_9BURK|nr:MULTISPECIES: ion transporter [Janthinobacterium]OHV98433.1 ion transporter [Janthinobacterium lividum]PIG28940.1 voltage-gated potassium channel [Janthinobacterium sp. 35]PVX38233.1 voltage-gated potassium channel [Janthinobacterium sp. 78]